MSAVRSGWEICRAGAWLPGEGQRCTCRQVAALGRSLAAVGGRLDSLLVAATSQDHSEQAVTPETILTGAGLSPATAWRCAVHLV